MAKKMSMAELIQSARLFAEGVRNHKAELAKSDLDDEKAKSFEALAEKIAAMDLAQERKKAELKAATAEIEAAQTALQKDLAAAKKMVKYFVPQESWREFGIDDKK